MTAPKPKTKREAGKKPCLVCGSPLRAKSTRAEEAKPSPEIDWRAANMVFGYIATQPITSYVGIGANEGRAYVSLRSDNEALRQQVADLRRERDRLEELYLSRQERRAILKRRELAEGSKS